MKVLRPTLRTALVLTAIALGLGPTSASAQVASPRVAATGVAATTSAATNVAGANVATRTITVASLSATQRLTKLVAEAEYQTTLGISYSYGGGHGPSPAPLNSHVDCSGFIRELYAYAFGVDIGSGAADGIRTSGKFTKTSHPVPGDVALFGNGGAPPAFHGGIYIGLINGHPAMVASPATGQNIKVQLGLDQYWAPLIMGYWHYNGAAAGDSVTHPKMMGSLDVVVGIGGGVWTAGWVVDPANAVGRATARVSIDGREAATLTSQVTRPDVNRALHVSGIHGFSAGIPTTPGRHTVCLSARSAGTSTTAVDLGCRSVTIPALTRGALDLARGGRHSFTVVGWAADPHASNVSNWVKVTLDGRTIANVRAAGPRPDVNRALRITGGHGFAAILAAPVGRHAVCTMSLPTSAASVVHTVGCRIVTANA